jgi:hypothetical protein
MIKFEDFITEASANVAVDKFDELHDILMKTDAKDKLKDAHMKTKKEAARIFQQAIKLLKGLK